MARRCGYCGSRGHNRRTCGYLTAAIQQQFEDAIANRDWHLDNDTGRADTYIEKAHRYAEALAKRTGTNPLTGEKPPKPVRAKRKCSYCLGSGHNRRTCEVYAKDKNIYREATRIARRDVKARIEALGVGIGTLFIKRNHDTVNRDYSFKPRPFIVVGHRLSEYSYSSSFVQFLGVPPAAILGDRSMHGTYITLSTLEINKRKLEEAREKGWEEDVARERGLSLTGSVEFSEDWLAAEDHTIVWENVEMFLRGKVRDYAFTILDGAGDHGLRPDYRTALFQAAENLGYVSRENNPS